MAFLAPALAGMLQSLGFVLNAGIGADQWFAVFSSFWAGDAAGVTAIAPLVLHLLGWSRHKWGVVAVVSRNWLRGQEGLVTLAQWAVLLMGIWIAFAAPLSGDLNYQYMVFVPLVLFAVQRGYTGSLVAVLTINVAILFLDRKTPTTQNI
jgi:integral membrane sensor domain MASE1